MKNVALLFFLLLLNSLTAQEYTPMLEVGKIWNMERHNDTGSSFSYNIKIMNTTEINGFMYYSVETSSNCAILLREDTIEKKVYRLLNDQDVLMFDFSLDVGDNVPNNFIHSPFAFGTLINEVEVDAFFGIPDLKYFGFEFYGFKIVESIGLSGTGILNCFDEGCQSIGIFEWDILVGMNEELNTNDFFSQNNIHLFYNVLSNNLEINTNETVNVTLYSVLGEKIIASEMTNQISLSNIKTGVYFYNLRKGNSVKKGKILVY